MKYKKTVFVSVFLFLVALGGALFSQESQSPDQDSPQVNQLQLSLEQAIRLVLHRNLKLRSASYDVKMSDTEYLDYMGRFAIQLSAETLYSDQKAPASGLSSSFGGSESNQFDATVSISKLFSTGTLVSGGLTESLYDQNDQAIPGFKDYTDPAFHKPVLFFSIQQELLRNVFGYGDRQNLKILEGMSKIQRRQIIDQLSGLVVNTLVQYWQVLIEKSAVKNAELELKSTRQIRNIVAKNVRIGLAEEFDLNQYEALVAAAKSKLALARHNHSAAVRDLLRLINMPADTKIEGVTELSDHLPELNYEEARKSAFEKRVDYRNALEQVEIAQWNIDLARNMALPSVTANFSISAMGQSDVVSTALDEVLSFQYPAWSAGVKVSVPLGDTSSEARIRNAEYKLAQAKIRLEELKKELVDDVKNRFEQVRLYHDILKNNRIFLRQTEAHYRKLLKRVRSGRFNSIAVKGALDNRISARQQELQALVQYNIALLRFDLAKNEIFEKYNINIEELLKKVK